MVVGVGGYASAATLDAASSLGIPTLIQEQNSYAGVTNKHLAAKAKKICVAYDGMERFFPADKIIMTGNPVRQNLTKDMPSKEEALGSFHLQPGKKTILIVGGSLGARTINNAMLEAELALSGRAEIQVLHATGDVNYEAYMAEIKKRGGVADNIIVKPYLHNMPVALAAADLAVFRAGAIGLAELMAKGVPSLLVPYPYATANHQEFNARAVEAQGAAKVILDKDLTGDTVLEFIEHLLVHEEELQQMHAAAQKLGRPQAAEVIAKEAVALTKQ